MLRTGIPTVDLNDQVKDLGLPQIHSDHAAIARMAANHLMDRGFRHFAFFGFPVFEWSVRRREAFVQCVCEAGHTFYDNKVTPRASWGHQQVSWQGGNHRGHQVGQKAAQAAGNVRGPATRAKAVGWTPVA